MKRERHLLLVALLTTGFIASCGGGSGGAYSALFGDGPKALKPAQAQCTITVSDSNGNGSIDNADIQAALNTASTNNQDDVVCIPAGNYNITSTLTYNLSSGSSECGKKLTIRADGGSVILDGGNSVQILSINTSNCSDDANGDITIEGITFQDGESSSSSGGLYVRTKNANITLTNNTFSGNSADYGGAYVYSYSGSITLTNNTFSSNSAYYAGGAYVHSYSGSITLTNNTFSGNSAYYDGGAYIYSNSGSVTLSNNTFSYNDGGGAYVSSSSGSITLTNNTFDFNSADDDDGGGAYIYSNSGSITLTNNTFDDNSADFSGGGAYIYSNSGSVTLTNNTFSDNTGGDGGGADVYSYSGSITLTNNTFSGNRANFSGGGVYVYLYEDNATLNFYNNILWNNTANAGGNDGDDLYVDNDRNGDNTPSPVNLAHNLFSTSTPSIDFSNAPQTEKVYIMLAGNYNQNIASGCTNSGQYGNIQADPLFADADLRLQASSPAINAGCNNAPSIPSTDKDGNQRIVGTAVDMGAYEYQGQQQPQQYTLTVNKSGTGSGTVTSNPSGINCGSTCSANFDANTTVTLTATASSGSIFAGWSGDCSSCVGITCSVLMDANKTCNVSFMMPTAENTARLYVFWDSRPDLGNVKVDPPNLICNGTCRVDIYRGLQVRLTAIPSSGARFLGWSGACSTCGFSSSCVITMDSSKSCRVRFGY